MAYSDFTLKEVTSRFQLHQAACGSFLSCAGRRWLLIDVSITLSASPRFWAFLCGWYALRRMPWGSPHQPGEANRWYLGGDD